LRAPRSEAPAGEAKAPACEAEQRRAPADADGAACLGAQPKDIPAHEAELRRAPAGTDGTACRGAQGRLQALTARPVGLQGRLQALTARPVGLQGRLQALTARPAGGAQSKKLEAEVLAPMARWTSAYTTVQARGWPPTPAPAPARARIPPGFDAPCVLLGGAKSAHGAGYGCTQEIAGWGRTRAHEAPAQGRMKPQRARRGA